MSAFNFSAGQLSELTELEKQLAKSIRESFAQTDASTTGESTDEGRESLRDLLRETKALLQENNELLREMLINGGGEVEAHGA